MRPSFARLARRGSASLRSASLSVAAAASGKPPPPPQPSSSSDTPPPPPPPDPPAMQSRARVYADVNTHKPRSWWDYEALNVDWG